MKPKVVCINEEDSESEILLDQMLEFRRDQEEFLRYECLNAKCFYATSDKYKLDRHQAVCRSTTMIKYKQEAKNKPDDSIRRQLVEEEILPDMDWHNWHFATWDVESLMSKKTHESGQMVELHRLVSIAVKSSFGSPEESEHYIERASMQDVDVRQMMQEFIQLLTSLQEEMVKILPATVVEGQKYYMKMVYSEDFKHLPVAEQAVARAKLRMLKDIMTLKIYSWNGERYDNNVIWAPLLDVLQWNVELFSKMTIIRRGSGIMEFSYGNLKFRDFKNFSNPISLEKFAESCGVEALGKTTWPYELYDDIRSIKDATEFPGYSGFQSSLTKGQEKFPKELTDLINENFEKGFWTTIKQVEKFFDFPSALLHKRKEDGSITEVRFVDGTSLESVLHTSPKKFFESKLIFDRTCKNMSEYLRDYNLNDVLILTDCIKRYAKGFFDSWKINIHDYMSLPGVSQG